MDYQKAQQLMERAAAELRFNAQGKPLSPRRAASIAVAIERFLKLDAFLLECGRRRLYGLREDAGLRLVAQCITKAN